MFRKTQDYVSSSLNLFFSGFCCDGHINATVHEMEECIRHLDEFADYFVSCLREL
jgi:hypothetical protein